MIGDHLWLLAQAASLRSPALTTRALVVVVVADAAPFPVVATGTERGALEGAQSHRRVLHEYREQESQFQRDRDHEGIIRDRFLISTSECPACARPPVRETAARRSAEARHTKPATTPAPRPHRRHAGGPGEA